jgi:hypothetical protein
MIPEDFLSFGVEVLRLFLLREKTLAVPPPAPLSSSLSFTAHEAKFFEEEEWVLAFAFAFEGGVFTLATASFFFPPPDDLFLPDPYSSSSSSSYSSSSSISSSSLYGFFDCFLSAIGSSSSSCSSSSLSVSIPPFLFELDV